MWHNVHMGDCLSYKRNCQHCLDSAEKDTNMYDCTCIITLYTIVHVSCVLTGFTVICVHVIYIYYNDVYVWMCM